MAGSADRHRAEDNRKCFETGWRAFSLAERYQCPVIVLTDM
jgi:pyruvate/2-oxoacid:ferredoxin oxidoreductase alpha subunit